ncbi:WXG100 family type VII secretion target [Pseudonocardia sp. H11422]|uniref:WXG100 family type VII secretion target n=1 Tax=Pseudonocardia sp. H11422 TaxID=2835866 RepID=UPI001BDD3E21|nr:WXG100 family type VII secretion target [Pseudonocardia sp. H11422]
MPPTVQLDPDRLRAHAVRAAELADVLRPQSTPNSQALLACRQPPGGEAFLAELDRLTTTVRRAADELANLARALRSAAVEVETVDRDLGRDISLAEQGLS